MDKWTSEPVRIGDDDWRLFVATTGSSIRTGFEYRPRAFRSHMGDQWRSAQEHHRPPLDKLEPIRAAHAAHINSLTPDGLRTRWNSELTPTGEQGVIPGCERNLSPRAVQLDLF